MNEDYKKQIELSEKLGAVPFQKVVFGVEKLKFKVEKKLFPNLPKWYDKQMNKRKSKELKKVTSEEQRQEIISRYRTQKMIFRKEFYSEQNRNYHMDENKPLEILNYLEWNKSVHKKGLKTNAVLIPILGAASLLGFVPAIPLLCMETGAAFINFQCVNLQNYNIARVKERADVLQKMADRKNKRTMEKYGQGVEVIDAAMKKTDDVPTVDDIISNIHNKEQAEQLKKFLELRRMRNEAVKKNEQTKTLVKTKSM